MDWAALRDDFPATRHWAFFDHAGVSAPSAATARVLAEFALDLSAHGIQRVNHWAERLGHVRDQVARLIGANRDEIAFTGNTSDGLQIVAEGYPWQPGDNVVFAAGEYPANQYVWMNLAARGVESRRLPGPHGRVGIDDYVAAIDGRTRVVAVSFVQFTGGHRVDLAALGQACRERGVHLCVDAIQGLGVLPLDVARLPIDFLACGGHKWLLGFQGAGFLYLRRDLTEFLRPTRVGAMSVERWYDYSTIDFTLKPSAGRWESGTLNFGGIAALGESLKWFETIGHSAVTKRIRAVTDDVCERAARAGWHVEGDRSGDSWSGIVSLDRPGSDIALTVETCRRRGIAVSHRGGRLRVAPHVYTNADDLDRLFEVLAP